MNALKTKKKKNDDDIATLSAISKATSKKYLDGTGLGHLSSLIVSFVRNYAAAKTHNHDGVYAAKSHNHDAGNITSGVLPIGRGGTGATTAKQAQVNLLKNDMDVASTPPYDDSCFAFAEQPGNENATNGVLYRRRAKDVWTYFNNKIKSLYLPLTGGTVTGLLKTPGGTMVHNAGGTQGTVGYINIAEFNLAGTTYQNMPIQLDVFRRRMPMATRLYIWFDPVDSSDPAIATLGYEGAGTDTDFYLYKSATSTWQLYIKKAEAYDSIGIADYKTNFLYMRHKITFKDVQVSSVPSGAIAGKYCDVMRATAIKDAGDGRTLKMNYSADALANADLFAVWNGNTLQSMHKNTIRGVIGAAPSSHTHAISQVTNLQSALDGKQPKGNYAAASHQHGANEITSGVLPVAFGGTGLNLYGSGYSGIPYVFKGQPQLANIGAANNTVLMNNAGTLTFNQISSSHISDLKAYLLTNIYKVGYVWISYTNTSPASILGGTWVAITGRFPYFNAGTSVGGSDAHRHILNDSAYAELNSEGTVIEYKNFDNVFFYADWKIDGGGSYGAISKPLKNGVAINGTTGSAGHLPPYQTLYAWRRTA